MAFDEQDKRYLAYLSAWIIDRLATVIQKTPPCSDSGLYTQSLDQVAVFDWLEPLTEETLGEEDEIQRAKQRGG